MKPRKPYRTSGGSPEWFSPPHIIEAARAVLGAIDLDPASCAEANEVVRAAKFYTAEQDGLTKEWRGRVWLNCPYSRKLVAGFTQKLRAEVAARRTRAVVAITNNSSDTEWWHNLATTADAMCFLRGRVRFRLPRAEATRRELERRKRKKKPTRSPMQGSVCWYFGPNPLAFAMEFSKLGLVRTRRVA